MIAFSVSPLTLAIADGDISRQSVDAIVNAANTQLWMGAGVAGAIKARGGRTIERDAMAQGPIGLGDCVVTSMGTIPVPRFVIHAAVMGPDLRTSAAIISRATANALVCAEELAIQSIAFPALGTGIGGFPIDECVNLMLTSIRTHAKTAGSLRHVRLILFGGGAYREAAEVAGDLLGSPLDGPPDCPVSG